MNSLDECWRKFTFSNITVSWGRVNLHLKRNFTTAHSTSLMRTNFFVKIEHQDLDVKSYGQCGLPPKKPSCYLADCADCESFMQKLQNDLNVRKQQLLEFKPIDLYNDLFYSLKQQYFSYCHPDRFQKSQHSTIFKSLLIMLSSAKHVCIAEFKAANSALQFAIFDFWAKIIQKQLTEFIFCAAQSNVCSSFYTLSFQSQDEMISNATQSLKYTPFIKIKYIDDIPSLFSLLQLLEKQTVGSIKRYIIDANASWKIQSALNFNQTIQQQKYSQLKPKVMYIEQPFPISMTSQQQQKWSQFKDLSAVRIIVDQSFAGYQDIVRACKLGHGVNIKSQKAGGPIDCLRAAQLAQQNNLQIMLGSMVSTHLGCSQTYCLHPLTQWLDVDGSLLVASPSFIGGFGWCSDGYLTAPSINRYGVQIE